MTKIRLLQLTGLSAVLAWFFASGLPASAMPAPPPDDAGIPAAPAPPEPAQPIVVHDHVSLWAYVAVAAVAVVVTLVLVALVRYLRRRPAALQHAAA